AMLAAGSHWAGVTSTRSIAGTPAPASLVMEAHPSKPKHNAAAGRKPASRSICRKKSTARAFALLRCCIAEFSAGERIRGRFRPLRPRLVDTHGVGVLDRDGHLGVVREAFAHLEPPLHHIRLVVTATVSSRDNHRFVVRQRPHLRTLPLQRLPWLQPRAARRR